jgi:hypothetical protein
MPSPPLPSLPYPSHSRSSPARAGARARAREGESDSDRDPGAYSPDFLRFWAAYPRKAKKGAAAAAWRKVKPRVEDVLAALEWQRGSPAWLEQGGRFIPHPATYLNAKCWEDERSGYEAHEQANGAKKGPGPLPVWQDPVMDEIDRERAK